MLWKEDDAPAVEAELPSPCLPAPFALPALSCSPLVWGHPSSVAQPCHCPCWCSQRQPGLPGLPSQSSCLHLLSPEAEGRQRFDKECNH